MSFYNEMAVADRGPNVPIVFLAYQEIADRVLDKALKDVTRESTRVEACRFFESGNFRLYADVLGVDHERVLKLYREYRDGSKAHLSKTRPVTPEERGRAIAMFREGKNVTEIAEALGRSTGSISNALKEIREIPSRRYTTEAEKKRIVDLYRQGFKLVEICKITGRSHTSVSRWTKDASIH